MLNGMALVACLAVRSPAAEPPDLGARPVAVRVAWGGGQPQAWAGTIVLVREGTDEPVDVAAWRTLSTEADAAATTRAENGAIMVDQRRPVANDGVEITVPDVQGWRVRAALGPAAAGRPTATIDVSVAELLVEPAQQPLDGDGNRLSVRPGPGESLRVSWEAGRDPPGRAAIHRPGERLRCSVDPLLPARGEGSAVDLRMRLRGAGETAAVATQAVTLEPVVDAAASTGQPAARRVVRFRPVAFDVPLPDREGVWEVDLEAIERGGMRWSRPVATRTVQAVTVADTPVAEQAAEWRLVYELDPGSPRLHERLRRLPGVGLSNVPLPNVPLPSFARPAAMLQKLPSVPLPNMPLPSAASLSTLVPRLSGLLATGHSRVELHGLGPLLRLPPAAAASPAWEGIVIAGAQPGRPHAVEIEFPTDQEAVVGVSVLELDADHAAVRSRHAGGFRVGRERFPSGPPRLDVHRFVFWPTTRHPLVVISNSEPVPAVFGRVRILAGPGRLAAAEPHAGGRRMHAFLPTPEFTEFGAVGHRGREGGRPTTDWLSHLTGIDQFAQCLAAQGAAGAMLTVHSRGAALWPSAATRHAPRWDSGTPSESGLDAEPKDVLALVVRLFGRAGLRLVPALEFTAPVPRLEPLVARGGPDAAGILCVGRDGRPRRGDATAAYNILDPRVQSAVEEVVVELAARLAGPDAGVVDGVALLMPHDGWLHLPGVAWGLDDATFARFLAAIGAADAAGETAAGEGRFAARAAAVEGPLRDRWLDWRAGEIARFHGRLAERLAEIEPRWSLSLVPTTLLVAGEQAARFRPQVGRDVPADVLGELGLDPARSTAHRRVVFVGPRVRGGGGLADEAAVAAANRAAAAHAAAGAARRATVLLDMPRPLDVSGIVPHGPFGGAAAADAVRFHALATGGTRDRCLAESFVSADLEAVYDTAIALECSAVPAGGRAALEALPTTRLVALDRLPAPLVVRQARDGDATWVHVVNAAAAPVRATLALDGRAAGAADGVDGAELPLESAGVVAVDLPAWGMRAVRLAGGAAVRKAEVAYDEGIAAAVARGVDELERRRATLESPVPIAVLDNAGFELGAAQDAAPTGGPLPGWELLEPRRGSLAVVAGAAGGRAAGFSSTHGLATLRSNPFPPPASGRLSIAAWLRIRPGDPQPPLRMALEGVEGSREYYRFAAVGGLAGGRPLAAAWSLFVLQIDDLPSAGLESLRVRFDLLGPGAVEIDDVRVFDLAFDESQRVQLSRIVSRAEQFLAAGDLGGCVLELDGHWPRYLEAFVPLPAAPAAAEAETAPSPAAERTGVLERMWRLWQ